MVARYSDATKLRQAKFLAREGNCFVVEKNEAFGNGCNKPIWILYRRGEPRNVLVGKRSSIDGLLAMVTKAIEHE